MVKGCRFSQEIEHLTPAEPSCLFSGSHGCCRCVCAALCSASKPLGIAAGLRHPQNHVLEATAMASVLPSLLTSMTRRWVCRIRHRFCLKLDQRWVSNLCFFQRYQKNTKRFCEHTSEWESCFPHRVLSARKVGMVQQRTDMQGRKDQTEQLVPAALLAGLLPAVLFIWIVLFCC